MSVRPPSTQRACPDGGWGWVVVFSSFITIGFSFAMPKAITVFFKDIQDYYSVSSSDIAWISSIMLSSMYAGGPISSMLVNRFGSRPVVMVGGLMCSVAMITASFADSITHLYICIGVIGGFGLSFNLQPSLTIIGKYFVVKRPIANGVAMTGSPVFLSILAPFNRFLFDHFGWRGSFLILGALMLNCCVAGALMRPLGDPRPRCLTTQPDGIPAGAAQYQKQTEAVVMGQSTTQLKGGFVRSVNKALDLSLFKHKGFLIYIVPNVFLFLGLYAPVVFLAQAARSKYADEYSSAFLLTIMGFVDMFVRPGTGFIANTKFVRPRIHYFFSFAIVLNGLCHLLYPLARGYWGLVVYTVFFAVAFGMLFALVFECLMEMVGPRRFSSAVGLVTIIESCPMLLGPPLGGALVDITGDYQYLYLTCGAINLTAGVLYFILNIYYYRVLEREQGQGQVRDEQSQEKGLMLGVQQRGQPLASESGQVVVEQIQAFEETKEEEIKIKQKADESKYINI
ncbi:monocarboxylate transporter 2-like [Hypomesus transpacificus]|uniref:monocarboxylate transporter 2-like n=1 Tax=Hypomesus transpacificus TaxID=137520 RepID=UPI001F07F566|nr:monocarboxylate transporter 2-like [Hypomesus transpacificus]